MRRVSFVELSDERRSQALEQMLEHNQLNHHPRTQWWDDLEDIQEDIQFGYDPEGDFKFYLNNFNEVLVSIDE